MDKELIVITGAGSGIGAAVACAFSMLEYPLLLLGRDINKLEAMNLPQTICASVDITDRDALKKSLEKAIEVYGPVGCLVNNAGAMSYGKFDQQSPEEWERIIQTNVLGMFNGIHLVIDSMKERKTGTIINISSVVGNKTIPNMAAYCASKHAVSAFSETLRAELAEYNVRVITISPGGVNTDLHTHIENKQAMQEYEQWIKTINLLSPAEIADMVVYSYKLPQHICLRQVVISSTDQIV